MASLDRSPPGHPRLPRGPRPRPAAAAPVRPPRARLPPSLRSLAPACRAICVHPSRSGIGRNSIRSPARSALAGAARATAPSAAPRPVSVTPSCDRGIRSQRARFSRATSNATVNSAAATRHHQVVRTAPPPSRPASHSRRRAGRRMERGAGRPDRPVVPARHATASRSPDRRGGGTRAGRVVCCDPHEPVVVLAAPSPVRGRSAGDGRGAMTWRTVGRPPGAREPLGTTPMGYPAAGVRVRATPHARVSGARARV